MSAQVLWLVLFAALLHAVWNAAVQHGVRRRIPSAAVFIGAGIVCAFAAPWVALPGAQSWPFIVASALTHASYSVFLGYAYRTGDFSHSYPLMRGTPPLITAAAVALVAGETVTTAQFLAMVVLCAGIVSLVFEGRLRKAAFMASIGWAMLVAASIALYTTIDGIGVRVSGDALSYIVWLGLLEGLALSVQVLAMQGRETFFSILRNWQLTLMVGFLSIAGYGIVVWAMVRAPIALVAAARETSVIFAVLIGVVAFKERLTRVRIASIALVAVGLVAMRLA